MKRTRRAFIRAAAATSGLALVTGNALAGCKDHPCNKFGDREDQPGWEANEVAMEDKFTRDTEGFPPGHDKDDPTKGWEAHDKDDEMEMRGERVGHCKFDPFPE